MTPSTGTRPPHRLLPLLLLAPILSACDGDAVEPEAGPDLDRDLVVRYIQRLPEMEWVPNSADPAREGWPAPGQEVTWAAHVLNRSPEVQEGVAYRWTLDGQAVADGHVDLPAGGEAVVSLPWSWTFDRHVLAFEIDPADLVSENGEEQRNNRLEIFTDALSVGFWIEETLYEHFAVIQPTLGIGSTSFEDFANRQIRYYNEMFASAVYPETPDGVTDRYRLDKITIVPDGALPLVPPADTGFDPAQAVPDKADSTVDLMWGFATDLQGVYGRDSNQNDFSGFVQHELGHARYLVDVYALTVYHGASAGQVEIFEGDVRVAGSRYMPGEQVIRNGHSGIILYQPQHGLMNSQWSYVDRHSAGALNRIAGHRATAGSWNSPDNRGAYLNDLPAENRLVVTSEGEPLAGASVEVYRSEPDPAIGTLTAGYRMHYDDTPDMELTADVDGRVLLGAAPFGESGVVHEFRGLVNGTLIIRVAHDGRVGYGFLDVTAFNQAYWRGNTELADYELDVALFAP